MTFPATEAGGGLERFRPQLLSARAAPAEPPVQVDFVGAVLFADIAGFTPLTERLAERGREGSELLSDLLTGFFGELIDIVVDRGGDVWALAGDALLAIWDGGSDGDVAGAARSAASAALVVL
jgi:class 3 adenylate cyclase